MKTFRQFFSDIFTSSDSRQEQRLIAYIRQIESGRVVVKIHNGEPDSIEASIYEVGQSERAEYSEAEENLLKICRRMKYGDLIFTVENGEPTNIQPESVFKRKLTQELDPFI